MSQLSRGISFSEVPKMSTYRQKRALSKHVSSSNTDSKVLEELEQSLRVNMRRRGLSQHNSPSQPQLLRRSMDKIKMAQHQQSATKIIQKYGNTSFNITQVIEQYPTNPQKIINFIESPTRKEGKKKIILGLKSLDKETLQFTSQKVLRTDNNKIQAALITPKKTIVKSFKPPMLSGQMSGRIDRKAQSKALQFTQPVRSAAVKLIKKVEQLQQEVLKTLNGQKLKQAKVYFEAITNLLGQQFSQEQQY